MNFYKDEVKKLWNLNLLGQGMKIGHLDTGIDGSHPAFFRRIASFRRFSYSGFKEESVPAYDTSWHGTHTAGLVSGGIVSGHPIGSAFEAQLYAGMVIEEGNIIARILCGLDWLIDCGVQVVNLSLGLPFPTPVFKAILRAMHQHDILVVCPIGNAGAGRAHTPGYYPEVLSVGAATDDGCIAPFSGSYHLDGTPVCCKPDVIGLGVDILSAVPGGGLQTRSGTSIACAQIAGLAVLLRQSAPKSSATMVKEAIISSSSPCKPEQAHRAAHGLVNPLKAWQYLIHLMQEPSLSLLSPEENSEPSVKFIDPRLQNKCLTTPETAICESIFVFKDKNDIRQFRYFIDSHIRTDAQNLYRVKILKYAPVAILKAPNKLIREIIGWHSVNIASACDIDRIALPRRGWLTAPF
ncbi:MAG: S8/S53 family peptidase [Coleofasciculus sp. B1-GNL1-01]|uniref:S8 family peptidase n=1 Tax=Coleofasciculus sp. B1-GNL1-01 TaxID=3068484 RepID=UPI0033023E46